MSAKAKAFKRTTIILAIAIGILVATSSLVVVDRFVNNDEGKFDERKRWTCPKYPFETEWVYEKVKDQYPKSKHKYEYVDVEPFYLHP